MKKGIGTWQQEGIRDPATAIQNLIKKKAGKADVIGLAESILDSWGGPVGLATQAKQLYDDPMTPSSNKIRIIVAAMDVVKEAHRMSPEDHSVEKMSDEDIQSTLAEFFGGPEKPSDPEPLGTGSEAQ